MMTRSAISLPCLFAAFLLGTGFAAPAMAQPQHLSDPVYEKMAPEDPHPMEDLLLLGEEGDTRAQFILGDLYGKGKGGLPRNVKKSREWFEKSARGGYAQSFIRLAALEKRISKPEDAYKWYTLALESLPASERRWAQRALDELVKENKLTPAQVRTARSAAQEWKKPAAPAPKDTKKKPDKKTAAPVQTDTDTAALTTAPENLEPAAGDPSSEGNKDKPQEQN